MCVCDVVCAKFGELWFVHCKHSQDLWMGQYAFWISKKNSPQTGPENPLQGVFPRTHVAEDLSGKHSPKQTLWCWPGLSASPPRVHNFRLLEVLWLQLHLLSYLLWCDSHLRGSLWGWRENNLPTNEPTEVPACTQLHRGLGSIRIGQVSVSGDKVFNFVLIYFTILQEVLCLEPNRNPSKHFIGTRISL